jgi:phosphoribosylglycinamide formyltransferase-1
MSRIRVAILISGRGSNMRALIEAARAPDFPGEIALVLSSRPDAAGLDVAASAGIPTAVVDQTRFGSDRAAFDAALDRELRGTQIEFICLAGFMRILTEGFVRGWTGRVINIHPSLLPAFRGLHPQKQALEAGVSETGCTVHHVVPELDAGPSILQARVPLLPGDTVESLSTRILAAEHATYPLALRRMLEAMTRG